MDSRYGCKCNDCGLNLKTEYPNDTNRCMICGSENITLHEASQPRMSINTYRRSVEENDEQ